MDHCIRSTNLCQSRLRVGEKGTKCPSTHSQKCVHHAKRRQITADEYAQDGRSHSNHHWWILINHNLLNTLDLLSALTTAPSLALQTHCASCHKQAKHCNPDQTMNPRSTAFILAPAPSGSCAQCQNCDHRSRTGLLHHGLLTLLQQVGVDLSVVPLQGTPGHHAQCDANGHIALGVLLTDQQNQKANAAAGQPPEPGALNRLSGK
mmetsp:Transcript_45370/g.98443  ORF Transcript_45370/g.98443 Transcript_45370/m.98443 type:complete len:206 (-) Transcript_45370:1004-1621(-)